MHKCQYCGKEEHNFFNENNKECMGNMFYWLRNEFFDLRDKYEAHLKEKHKKSLISRLKPIKS